MVHVSGEQRLKMAQDRAQEKQASLQKDLDARRAGSSIHTKTESVSDREEEPMDTSSSVPNGVVNGYPEVSFNHTNGNGGASLELQDFVIKTFRKHFVVTLNEFKRLFHLHLASMPVGQSIFHSMSDHMLMDAIVLSHCKQIMVPVSIWGGNHLLLSNTMDFTVGRIKQQQLSPAVLTQCWDLNYFGFRISCCSSAPCLVQTACGVGWGGGGVLTVSLNADIGFLEQ